MMPRLSARMQPLRRIPLRRLAVVILLGVAGVFGGRMLEQTRSNPAPSDPPGAEPPSKSAFAFSSLRPRAGDHMTLPRLGFRWNFAAAGSSRVVFRQASLVPRILDRTDTLQTAGEPAGVRYVLHLLGPDGHPEIVQETDEASLRLNLDKDFPAGECEWWVEALVPGEEPVASPHERFTLSP